jgi:hypothetical protein
MSQMSDATNCLCFTVIIWQHNGRFRRSGALTRIRRRIQRWSAAGPQKLSRYYVAPATTSAMTFDNFGLYLFLGGYQLPVGNKVGLSSVIEAFPLNQAPNTLRTDITTPSIV